jgi:putative phosphoribosyl transferase
MKFLNRAEAGVLLYEAVVKNLKTGNVFDRDKLIVVGLPRGGVPVAFEVAKKLNCRLEIITSKKLPYPNQPEYAIGAVSSDGVVVLSPDIPNDSSWQAYVEQQRRRLCRETIALEEKLYRLSGRSRCTDYDGKIALVVDDGIATGMTAIAAAETAKKRGAKAVYVTAPVICRESFFELNEHCNGLIACEVPEYFQSVGFYYEDFAQTSEEEVAAALRSSAGFGSADASFEAPLNAGN